VFNLYSYQEKVNLSNNDILQVISNIELRSFPKEYSGKAYLDLLYSNSIWRQSSIPTSILIELLLSGGMRNECTQISLSFATSAIRRDIDTRTKYLHIMQYVSSLDLYGDWTGYLPQFDVDTLIALELFLNILEVEVIRLRLPHLSRSRELLR
jgi:hypothetical protein